MKGKIIFISGPSGVGKGTVIHKLRENHPEWVFPASCTTRKPRSGEVEGRTYHFISRGEFEEKIAAGEFLEYAEVHGGNLYGTLKKPLLEGVEQGKVVVREFDVQGFMQVREKLPRDDYISIFLKPDGEGDILIKRIKGRAPMSDEEVERRMKSMKKEMEKEPYYDHSVFSVEGKIDCMVQEVEDIISMEIISSNSKS